jgi:hypothetical protein
VSRRARELTADWLLVAAAAGLLASLFLTWSHQYPGSLARRPGVSVALAGIPREATAWQLYTVADVLLALLAGAILAAALLGGGRVRAWLLVLVAAALAFCAHAMAVPPTNGADVALPGSLRYLRAGASPGPGQTVAVVALGLAFGGLVASAYPGSRHVRNPRR